MITPELTLVEMEDGTCTIKADCTLMGQDVKSLNVPHSQLRMLQAIFKYQKGSLIQDCFHFLTAEQREFMLTGMTPIEQERFYNESQMGSQTLE